MKQTKAKAMKQVSARQLGTGAKARKLGVRGSRTRKKGNEKHLRAYRIQGTKIAKAERDRRKRNKQEVKTQVHRNIKG